MKRERVEMVTRKRIGRFIGGGKCGSLSACLETVSERALVPQLNGRTLIIVTLTIVMKMADWLGADLLRGRLGV
jgi:hypothetical protein